jgi:hypothetical protein
MQRPFETTAPIAFSASKMYVESYLLPLELLLFFIIIDTLPPQELG